MADDMYSHSALHPLLKRVKVEDGSTIRVGQRHAEELPVLVLVHVRETSEIHISCWYPREPQNFQ